MFVESLYWLLTNSDQLKLVLGTPDTRADGTTGMFPAPLPEASSLPAMTYFMVSTTDVQSLEGVNALGSTRIQFDCYAKTYGGAKAVANAVKDILEGFRGALTGGIVVGGTIHNLEQDFFEEAPYIHRCMLDFTVWYTDPLTEPYPVPQLPPDEIEILDGGQFV